MADTFNRELLQEQIDAEGIPNVGVNSAGVISFKDEATPAQRQQAAGILAAHNPNALSQAQQREAVKAQALQALQGNKIALVLAAIASDAGDIETDLTALGNLAVLNLANVRPLMTRLLNRQARILNRLEIIVKGLSHG